MSELRRLSSASPNPLTRELLAAGRDDAPSDDARRGAAIAIGIAGGLATTASAGGAAAGTATGTAAASKWLGAAGLMKLVVATVTTGALVAGAVHQQRSFVPSAAHVADSAARPRAPLSRRTPPPALAPLPPAPTGLVPEAAIVQPAIVQPAIVQPARAAVRAPALPDEGTLRDEVRRLDHVRVLLSGGRAAAALVDLDDYRRILPKGALRDEADLLRVEALALQGDVAAAKGGAERLLERDARGPHARRVRAILASLRDRSGAL